MWSFSNITTEIYDEAQPVTGNDEPLDRDIIVRRTNSMPSRYAPHMPHPGGLIVLGMALVQLRHSNYHLEAAR